MHNVERQTGARVRQVFVPADNHPLPDEPRPKQESIKGPSLAAANRSSRAEDLSSLREKNGAIPTEEHLPERRVSRADLVRGFEYEKNKYVEFEPEELEQIAPKRSSDMQILEFVRFIEIDPVYLESSYYVAPDTGGAKPYTLLFEALKRTGYAAIAEFVIHRRDQIIILRPGSQGIIGHTLFYEDEVKRENEFHADSGLIGPKEMELAVRLVDALAAPFQPEKFTDKYRERLRQAISEKVGTGAVKEIEPVTRKTPVIDIMAALTESLARAKKPVARELKTSASKTPERKKRTSGSRKFSANLI